MKKRTPLIIVSLVAAFTLLAVTAFASAPTYEGYEAFKDFAKNHNEEEFNNEDGGMTGTFTVTTDDITKTIKVYKQEDKTYIFDDTKNDVYVVDKKLMEEYHENEWQDYDENIGNDFRHNKHTRDMNDDHEMSTAQEELLDFIVGDLKDDFELTNNSDGGQTISFEMTKEEVPMLLNLMFSAMDSKGPRNFEEEEFEPSDELLAKYPILADMIEMKLDTTKITENMELDFVKMAITTEADKTVRGVEFNVIMSGDDENGVAHNVEINGEFERTEIGTITDIPKLDGKTLIEVDPADFVEFQNMKMNSPKGRR